MPNTTYIEYAFNVNPLQPVSDILIAELGEAGFESFVENEDGVLAYIQKPDWSKNILKAVEILNNNSFKITFQVKEIEQENWNATWEENFNPIQVGSQCVVRAPFHEKPDVEFDIVIEPKMSFGTGHHETTHMMLQHILDHDFESKSVLDMGSGTGVLAILAAMKGAKRIDAIDIDNWCYLNAKENVIRNDCNFINVMEGDVGLLKNQKYDFVLANINRNILLADIPAYASCINENGFLIISGFYESDVELLIEKCKLNVLILQKIIKKNDWVSIIFQKS